MTTDKIVPEDVLTDVLPDKLSDLLELAINDMCAISKNPAYRLDMTVWHTSYNDPLRGGNKCSVCMAGAVLANTLKRPTTWSWAKHGMSVPLSIQVKMEAIDMMRVGRFLHAHQILADLYDRPVLQTQASALNFIGTRIATTFLIRFGPLQYIDEYRDCVRKLREVEL